MNQNELLPWHFVTGHPTRPSTLALIAVTLIPAIAAAIVLASRLPSLPGPGDADARGPARTVTAWPWE